MTDDLNDNNKPIDKINNPPIVNEKKPYNKPTGKYIGEEKVALIQALDQMGVPKQTIADKLHVSRTTVHFLTQRDVNNPNLIEQVKKKMSAKWWVLAHNAVEAITPEKLMDANVAQLAVVGGIATEKARLIDGESTMNIAHIDKGDGQIEEEIRALETELLKMQAIPAQVVDNPPSDSPAPSL
jgi:hypothetical protein